MKTEICRELGIEFPIFAFSHCRDVVAAVSNVGGLGVLGAVGFGAKQLETELAWIDERVGDKPYGVDIVLPGKYEGKGEQLSAEALLLGVVVEFANISEKFAPQLVALCTMPLTCAYSRWILRWADDRRTWPERFQGWRCDGLDQTCRIHY